MNLPTDPQAWETEPYVVPEDETGRLTVTLERSDGYAQSVTFELRAGAKLHAEYKFETVGELVTTFGLQATPAKIIGREVTSR